MNRPEPELGGVPLPESQMAGFLAAATGDPEDFTRHRMNLLASRDTVRAQAAVKGLRTGTPFDLQIWR